MIMPQEEMHHTHTLISKGSLMQHCEIREAMSLANSSVFS